MCVHKVEFYALPSCDEVACSEEFPRDDLAARKRYFSLQVCVSRARAHASVPKKGEEDGARSDKPETYVGYPKLFK